MLQGGQGGQIWRIIDVMHTFKGEKGNGFLQSTFHLQSLVHNVPSKIPRLRISRTCNELIRPPQYLGSSAIVSPITLFRSGPNKGPSIERNELMKASGLNNSEPRREPVSGLSIAKKSRSISRNTGVS